MCFLHDSLAVVVVSIVFSLMWRRRRRTGIKSSATSKFRCHPSKRLSAIIIIISFKASQGFMMICRCQKWKIVPLISNAWPPKHSSFKYFHFLITHPCKILSVLIKIYVREEFAHFVENETIKITQYNNPQLLFSRRKMPKFHCLLSHQIFILSPVALWNGVLKNGEILKRNRDLFFLMRNAKFLSSNLRKFFFLLNWLSFNHFDGCSLMEMK